MRNRRKLWLAAAVIVLAVVLCAATAFAEGEEVTEHTSNMYATFWALVPPIVAIALALITKEVYSSLFVGIVIGGLFYANFNPVLTYTTIINDGFVAKIANSGNVGILIFLVALGTVVILINRAGGSAAYGRWAEKHIKTRKGAILATFALGVLIFVDDYFNCLTVGSVMRPITDKKNVSRAKLAYLIDATAAPVCMIAPISSWAAAVTGVIVGMNGLTLFIEAIPYNLYSLLTIAMIIIVTVLGIDFGPMKRHEDNALKGDLFTTPGRPYAAAEAEEEGDNGKGRVLDLVVPIIILIILCVVGMIYTGGFFDGVDFVTAFSECSASTGLALGSVLALIVIMIYMLCRRVMTFKDIMAALPEGFKAMVPAILILVFAWTLSGITSLLGADVYVSTLFKASAGSLANFLPAIVFAVAVGLSFATGTSWGTFGILLPIVVACGEALTGQLLIISISACLAGAVCGDHCSPISDTTIMSSTGAHCDHVNHVSTQLPYALFVAGVSFVGYIFAGFVQSAWIVLPVMIVVMLALLLLIRKIESNKEKKA